MNAQRESQKNMAGLTFTLDEFETLSSFIYRKCGIRFESHKIYFISKRIQKRMDSLGISSVAEYVRLLRFSDHKGKEFQNLIDLLTINETYFFRDFPQLQAFAEHSIDDVVFQKKKKGDRKIRIWSAACSTGEEPYTLAIILSAMLDNVNLWDIEILASDIDRNVLEKAQKGVYLKRSVRDVPSEYLDLYFIKHANYSYEVNEKIKKMVRFEHLNLGDKKTIRNNKGFDFIFCRNLLIYFDDQSRKQLVDQFYISLNKGGYIFLGSSESVNRISGAFKMKRMGNHLVYYK